MLFSERRKVPLFASLDTLCAPGIVFVQSEIKGLDDQFDAAAGKLTGVPRTVSEQSRMIDRLYDVVR